MNLLIGLIIECVALILLVIGRGFINKMITERIQQLQLKKGEFDYNLSKSEVFFMLLKMKRYSDVFSLLGFALIVLSGLACCVIGLVFQLIVG